MFRGFFNRMYNGNPNKPDVSPDDMPKNRFELFFTTLGLRFGDLFKINMLFALMILPIIIWTLLSILALNGGLSMLSETLGHTASDSEMQKFFLDSLFTYLLGLLICMPLAGPPLAGLTYVARNYARDEHVWLWSDFKEQMKKNWKQSVAVMLILALSMLLAFYVLYMYGYAIQITEWLWILRVVFIVFAILFFLSYMYVFPMLVTYKAKVWTIIKNSIMLALGRLPFTLLFGVLSLFPLILAVILSIALIESTVFSYIWLAVVLYYLLLGFSLTSFVLNSYTNATFDKLMRTDEEPSPPDDNDREIKP
jgi:uncharacterized membrane protein YesL